MSNFSFIPSEWASIAQTPQEAEQHVHGGSISMMLTSNSHSTVLF